MNMVFEPKGSKLHDICCEEKIKLSLLTGNRSGRPQKTHQQRRSSCSIDVLTKIGRQIRGGRRGRNGLQQFKRAVAGDIDGLLQDRDADLRVGLRRGHGRCQTRYATD